MNSIKRFNTTLSVGMVCQICAPRSWRYLTVCTLFSEAKIENDLRDRFDALDFSAEIAGSFMGGLVDVSCFQIFGKNHLA